MYGGPWVVNRLWDASMSSSRPNNGSCGTSGVLGTDIDNVEDLGKPDPLPTRRKVRTASEVETIWVFPGEGCGVGALHMFDV